MRFVVLISILAITMFSASTRALISRVPCKLPHHYAITRSSARYMSDSSTSETSVVSICQAKIQKALEAESVKVTGMWTTFVGMLLNIRESSLFFLQNYFQQVHSMIRMDHILVFKSFRHSLKVRGLCNGNNWSTRPFGKNFKGLYMQLILWFAKLPANNK